MILSIPNCKRQWLRAIAIALVCVVTMAGGVAMAAGGDASGGGHHNHWKQTDTAKTLNFVILAVVLFLILRKFVPKALQSRIDGIREQLADLEEQKNKAEADLTSAKQQLAQMEKEAEQIVKDYVAQGEAAKERIMAEAQKAAEKLEEQAKKNIDHEFKAAKETLKSDIVDQALAKAESLIVSKINDEDHDRLVNDYLTKVVA